jgi:GDP-mannose 6-dehydrogenase
MVDNIEAVLQHAETIVIGNKSTEFEGVPQKLQPGQCLVDFVRITNYRSSDGEYSGICW